MWKNEKAVEEYFISLLEKEGFSYLSNPVAKDCLIIEDLKRYLDSVCSKYEGVDIDSIISEIIGLFGNLYEINRKFCKWISDGYVYKDDASISFSLIDYENIDNNTFRVVNQFRVTGGSSKIIDIAIFINGFPLILFELKNPNDISQGNLLAKAFEDFQTYSKSVPELFKYNAFLVISNGQETKCGTLFSEFNHYYSWRKIEDEVEEPDVDSVEKLVKGVLRRERLIKILRDFIVFPSGGQEKKILCRYPQYFAATKALASIKKAQKPKGNGEGGICFGATGCGKSYAMLFLARLLLRESRPKPTIFVITDRLDLNNQTHKHFESAAGKQYLEAEVKCIDEETPLNKLTKSSANIFVTNIQKFRENTGQILDSNIVCIVDEAHRSINNWEEQQRHTDGKVQIGFGARLNNAFPNATFVGFTGTPLEITERIFGERIHQYDMKESIEDGFTVGIVFQEIKVGDLKKSKELDSNLDAIDRSHGNRAVVYKEDIDFHNLHLIEGIVENIIEHHKTRLTLGKRKAMVVCHNRDVAYSIYQAFEKFEPDWIRNEKIKLIISSEKFDPDELKKIIGNSKDRQNWANKFKEDESSLDIIIVADMLLTGFDVPSLDTMYIYKTITGHNLVQTISRVNRIFFQKTQGLIIDYTNKQGLDHYRKAVEEYCKHVYSDIFQTIEGIIIEFQDYLEKLNYFFREFDYSKEIKNLNRALEYVQKNTDTEREFVEIFKALRKRYRICVRDLSKQERDDFSFYNCVFEKLNSIFARIPLSSKLDKRDKLLMNKGIELDKSKYYESEKVEIISDSDQLINTKIKECICDIINLFNRIKVTVFRARLREQVQRIIDQYNARKGGEDLRKIFKDLKDKVGEIQEFINNLENINAERDSYHEILKEAFGEGEQLLELAEKIKDSLEERKSQTDWYKDQRFLSKQKVVIKKLIKGFGFKDNEKILEKIINQAKEWDIFEKETENTTFWDKNRIDFDY